MASATGEHLTLSVAWLFFAGMAASEASKEWPVWPTPYSLGLGCRGH